jgi:hypothetical protein
MPHAKRKAVRKPIPSRRAPTQAIVVRAPAEKPWLLQPEEITLIKNVVCKGASDVELQYCLTVARRYKLDPFQGQIWFVPRWDSEAQRTDGRTGTKVFVPVVGINGMLHIAARDHRDFGSYSQPEYGPMITVEYQKLGQGPKLKLQVPEWARVSTKKKGCTDATVGEVWWEEIYKNIDFAPTVRQMPRLMLAKCARAQATRTAYPSTGGLLIPEETHGPEFENITPGGRLITPAEPVNPALEKYLEREKEQISKLTPAQREVVERKMSEAEEAKKTLGYRYYQESETYRIGGPAQLIHDNMELLKELWSPVAKSFVANASQLGKLISQFEQRGVRFKNMDAREDPKVE